MENRPSSSSKSIAENIADLVFSGDKDYEKLEKMLSLLDAPSIEKTLVNNHDNSPVSEQFPCVGIWQQSTANKNSYKRDPRRQNEWPLWADVPEIKPKSSKKRVLLFGESVARGFLYDPYYSVAKELQASLFANHGIENTEVIDLARIALQMPELLALIRSSAILEPDAVVIFAGNNWFFAANTHPIDFTALTEIYKKGHYAAVKEFLEKMLDTIVKDFLRSVEAVFHHKKIPVVFVIPEFNLKDWKSAEIERIPAWSTNGSIEKWLKAAEDIQPLHDKYNDEFKNLAEQMIASDNSNPWGYELMGQYYAKHEQPNKARKYFEDARETVLFNRSNNSMPRCVSAIRQAILEEAPRCRMMTVDLPQVFREAYPNSIPDRKIFLDNCHLTADAIKTVVSQITPVLIKNIPGLLPCSNVVKVPDIAPSNHVKAVAHFSAAIYNAHHAQPYEMVAYHCHKAVAFSPAIKETMKKFIDFSTRKANSFLCKSFHDLMLTGELTQYEGGFSLGHPRNNKLFDALLVDSIVDALESAGLEKDIKKSVTALRLKDHVAESTNLLETCYWKQSYIEFASPALADFLQVRAGENSFYFIADAENALSFQLTFRTPGKNAEADLDVFVNDEHRAGKFSASANWTSVEFSINRELIKKGINKLTFKWPCANHAPLNAAPSNADAFLRNIFPVFGEIYTLTMFTTGSSSIKHKHATTIDSTVA